MSSIQMLHGQQVWDTAFSSLSLLRPVTVLYEKYTIIRNLLICETSEYDYKQQHWIELLALRSHKTIRPLSGRLHRVRRYFEFWLNIKAKPHGCCIFSMILHEAPSMETTTPKGEWFPCWVAEWSIMENMQQQMWFCFYPSPISINISIYVYNALRLTPEIWFWAMPFASFQIDINKYFAIVSPCCQVISNCDVISPWITWQNNRLMISRFAILSREYLLQTALYNQ